MRKAFVIVICFVLLLVLCSGCYRGVLPQTGTLPPSTRNLSTQAAPLPTSTSAEHAYIQESAALAMPEYVANPQNIASAPPAGFASTTALFAIKNASGLYGVINANGTQVLPFAYNSVQIIADALDEPKLIVAQDDIRYFLFTPDGTRCNQTEYIDADFINDGNTILYDRQAYTLICNGNMLEVASTEPLFAKEDVALMPLLNTIATYNAKSNVVAVFANDLTPQGEVNNVTEILYTDKTGICVQITNGGFETSYAILDEHGNFAFAPQQQGKWLTTYQNGVALYQEKNEKQVVMVNEALTTVTKPRYISSGDFVQGIAVLLRYNETSKRPVSCLVDASGKELYSVEKFLQLFVAGESIFVQELAFSGLEDVRYYRLQNGNVQPFVLPEGDVYPAGTHISGITALQNNRLLFTLEQGETVTAAIYDTVENKWIVPPGKYTQFLCEGAQFYAMIVTGEHGALASVLDKGGNVIISNVHPQSMVQVCGGMIACQIDNQVGIVDATGEWIYILKE